MPTVSITNAAMDVVRSAALQPLRQDGVRVGPDEWRVPLADDTVDRIKQAALKGETLSETIIRVVNFALLGGKRQ